MWLHIFVGMCLVTPLCIAKKPMSAVFPCSHEGSLDEFKCQNETTCVSVKYICDGIPNCSDASDEEFCPHSSSDLLTEDIPYRRRRQSSCVSDQWECRDGSCISLDNICDGVNDCLDRSDETHPFCKKLSSLTKSGGCVLPPYPAHGTYEVSKFPNARPGQAFDSFVLTISCRRGFGVVDPYGGEGSGTQQLYCVNGEYQYQSMPRCVRFCKLNPDPSVRYTCHVPGVGFKTCKSYVAPGTLVNPICNSPIYYSADDSLPYMKCNYGFWDYVAQCKAECGRVTPEGGELVIDGKQARRGELPWHAGIYRKTTTPYMQICGGTVIANNVVLSAAHCFWSDVRKKLPASDFAVAVGKLYRDWDSEIDIGSQKSDVLEIRIPIRFQGAATNFQEDIAALILKTPFIYMTYIRPVCLYYDVNFERVQLQQGNSGKVAGWGLTSAQGEPSDTLQVIEMPFVNVNSCIKTFPPSFIEYITSDKFCAGHTTGKALCKGDSGGGLAFPDRGLGVDRYYLRGIVSTAPRDDMKLCNDYVYTTFTMITKHQEFIKEALAASADKKCPQYSFQCNDGSCVDQGADCNGIQDCADGSDELDELCIPGAKPKPAILTIPEQESVKKPSCTLPPFPQHGTYETNIPNSTPGQSFDSVTLTVTCTQNYGIERDGYATNSTVLNCTRGEWDRIMPKCVRVCKLSLDSSIDSNYTCLVPALAGLQRNECTEYVSSGTVVSVRCNSPDYYSDEPLQNMRCISGYWDYYPRCKAECGRVRPNAYSLMYPALNSPRIEDTPWHVGIHRKTPKPYMQICGGSIVSNKIVITAAHCFWNKGLIRGLLPASDYAVAAGKLYRAWSDFRDAHAQKSDVMKIDTPRTFDGYQKDIAILSLVTPFVYTVSVRPVCLDFSYELNRRQLQEDMVGLVAGWGQTSVNGNFSPIIKLVKMQNANLRQCVSKTNITNDKFCARLANGNAGLCNGDGGGGLVFQASDENRDRFYLRGIVSRPTDDENVCNDSPYNVFTTISIHEQFIKQLI